MLHHFCAQASFTHCTNIFRGIREFGAHSLSLSGLVCGNNKTSCIEGWLVINMQSLSIPIPIPLVGGIPYSSALKKS